MHYKAFIWPINALFRASLAAFRGLIGFAVERGPRGAFGDFGGFTALYRGLWRVFGVAVGVSAGAEEWAFFLRKAYKNQKLSIFHGCLVSD